MYYTYIIRVWLSTMVSGPLLFAGLLLIVDSHLLKSYSANEIIWLLILIGFSFSIPTLLCLGLVASIFKKQFENTKTFKAATILFSIFCIIVTLLLFTGEASANERGWIYGLAFLYAITLTAFGLIYKIKPKQKVESY